MRDHALYVNLFLSSVARLDMGQQTVTLEQATDYPWHGRVRFTVKVARPIAFALHIRVPGWAQGRPAPSDLYRYLDDRPPPVSIELNGQAVKWEMHRGFALIARTWADGGVVSLELAMPVRRVVAHPQVQADGALVALERGPIVYCFEEVDDGTSVFSLVLADETKVESEFRPEFLGGVVVLSARGVDRVAPGVRCRLWLSPTAFGPTATMVA